MFLFSAGGVFEWKNSVFYIFLFFVPLFREMMELWYILAAQYMTAHVSEDASADVWCNLFDDSAPPSRGAQQRLGRSQSLQLPLPPRLEAVSAIEGEEAGDSLAHLRGVRARTQEPPSFAHVCCRQVASGATFVRTQQHSRDPPYATTRPSSKLDRFGGAISNLLQARST